MEKSTRKVLFVLTYAIVLYWILTNIQQVSLGLSGVLSILSPIFIGLFIAFILNVLLNFIENVIFEKLFKNVGWIRKKKRVLSVILTYLVTIAIVATIVFFIFPQVARSLESLGNKLPQYLSSLQKNLMDLLITLGITDVDLNEVFGDWQEVTKSIKDVAGNTMDALFDITINVASAVVNFFLGLIFSIYFLLYKDKLIRIARKLIYTFTPKKVAEKVAYIFREINKTFTRFIGGQLTEAFILGGMCFLGMTVLGLPYAPLIGVLIGITSLIPILGAYIGTVPSAFILLMENPMQALIFIVFLIIIQQIEGNFIYPKVVGNAIGLDGLWVFLAITIGGKIMGILGMILGVPSVAVIYTLMRKFTNKRYHEKFKKE